MLSLLCSIFCTYADKSYNLLSYLFILINYLNFSTDLFSYLTITTFLQAWAAEAHRKPTSHRLFAKIARLRHFHLGMHYAHFFICDFNLIKPKKLQCTDLIATWLCQVFL